MRKLPSPESQEQEVLFELYNRTFIDRRSMMLSAGVLNLTANISKLRMKGFAIASNKVTVENKFGREVSFVRYSLQDKKEASVKYLKMKEKQLQIF